MQTDRQRSARYRERLRRDRIVLHVEVPHAELTHALELAGLLSPEQIDDRYAITRAVEDLLEEFLSRVTSHPV